MAGILPPDSPSTMQRTEGARLVEARFGWGPEHLYLLLIPRDRSDLDGLEIDLTVTYASVREESVFHMALAEDGRVDVACTSRGYLGEPVAGAWQDVVELALPAGLFGAPPRRTAGADAPRGPRWDDRSCLPVDRPGALRWDVGGGGIRETAA